MPMASREGNDRRLENAVKTVTRATPVPISLDVAITLKMRGIVMKKGAEEEDPMQAEYTGRASRQVFTRPSLALPPLSADPRSSSEVS
mmetsp:Transcript_35395/g.53221  ORF Transcript_35395/g.53221 Transcript_35395/m.53221 type:complete len:88 (-) Transcript_35395:94-357(-)